MRINDARGGHRLPNGHTVSTSRHAGPKDVKLTEITRDKKIVWTHRDETKPVIRHFQILDTVEEGKTPAVAPALRCGGADRDGCRAQCPRLLSADP